MRPPHHQQPEHPCARTAATVRECYLCGTPYVYRPEQAPQASGYCSRPCYDAVTLPPRRAVVAAAG